MTIRIMNSLCEWRIGDNGQNLGFFDIKTGRNHADLVAPSPCAYIKKGDWRADCCKATYADEILLLTFADNSGSAQIKVKIAEGYFVFTVLSVQGDFDELDFINIPTDLTEEPDQPFSACTIALSLKSNVEELPGPQGYLWTAAYRRFGFEGAETGLVASSFAAMREYMKQMVGDAPGVPHSPLCGPWAQDSPLPAVSNVMQAPTLQNVDEWIDFCKQMGIGAMEFNGTLDYGSYEPNPAKFPNGFADVRKVVDKLHAAGILAGLHTMSFSIAKNCSWVTPKPDPRLAKERSYTLAEDLDETADAVSIVEDTSDLPKLINYYVRRSQTLQIDDELIEFKEVKDEAPYGVLKCKRGACGTIPAVHKAGAKVHHLKECWGCFAPDGDSTLFSEVADRISTAVNKCNFDFVYLDGLDGSHIIGGEEARWHYGAKFTFEVFRGLEHPIMMEMATFHHHLWYVRTRMQAWDHGKLAHKRFHALHVYSNSFARKMFLPLHMGWAGLFPWLDQQTDQTFWDDVEYMYSKSLATNANFTLQCLTPSSLRDGAWLSDLAPAIKHYEELRQSHHFPEEVLKRLANTEEEFRLCPTADGKWNFQPIHAERHQVDSLEGISDAWQYNNPFKHQKLALRIQALPSVERYDSDKAVTLAAFDGHDAIGDPGDTITILNSGKLYTYPSSAPGASSSLKAAKGKQLHDENAPVERFGIWQGKRDLSNGLVPSSGPDDRYSLCDHFERAYSLREASWTCQHLTIPETNLKETQGVGLWIKGDGKGEVANIVLCGRSYGICRKQFYVKIDFTGWRYIELLTSITKEFEDYSWPFSRCHYDIYRSSFYFERTLGMDFWLNNIPKGGEVSLAIGPIKALPLVNQPIVKPVVFVNGRPIMFPILLKAGQYLEYYGEGNASVYDGKGNLLGEVAPVGVAPTIASGRNHIGFTCEPSPLRPHARVTLFTKSDELIGDAPNERAPAWGHGCIASPVYGSRTFATIEAQEDDSFLAP